MVVSSRLLRINTWRCAALVSAVMLLSPVAWPQEAPARAPIRFGTTPESAPPVTARPAGEMEMTAYSGFGHRGPGQGSRNTPLELDLTVAFAACPDDNLEISTLHIGGWRYSVPGVCENSLDRGSVSVEGIRTTSVVATTRPASDDAARKILRCDPATWRCGPVAP